LFQTIIAGAHTYFEGLTLHAPPPREDTILVFTDKSHYFLIRPHITAESQFIVSLPDNVLVH